MLCLLLKKEPLATMIAGTKLDVYTEADHKPVEIIFQWQYWCMMAGTHLEFIISARTRLTTIRDLISKRRYFQQRGSALTPANQVLKLHVD